MLQMGGQQNLLLYAVAVTLWVGKLEGLTELSSSRILYGVCGETAQFKKKKRFQVN